MREKNDQTGHGLPSYMLVSTDHNIEMQYEKVDAIKTSLLGLEPESKSVSLKLKITHVSEKNEKQA